MKNYHTSLSQEILLIAKSQEDTSSLRRQLFYIRQSKLEKSLDTDDLKKTFWINIYNAFYLIISKDTPDHLSIYKWKRIKIARSQFSLDDIEHGILRKLKFKLGFGFFTNPFYSNAIKILSVNQLDYRIHFALRSITLENTLIDYYDCENIEKQLKQVTHDFIHSETQMDSTLKLVRTSKFLLLYFRDFGGMSAVKNLLRRTLKTDFKGYTIQFKNTEKIEKIGNVS